ncbi:GNAT family N-acetyltransferase [Thalassococcus sp. S3]|uniref:GNAT family N-acetyltransferase n=1 Tax=Thalassococcus sp. S3 TaxID=2017482 RepID=UPI001024248F|nr:GNAT family N-acetyltransferase [Thalassococcus sp. S3]QBF30303.1 GNAT family N-acetyltransferase [Thalassococcus sp. S3]
MTETTATFEIRQASIDDPDVRALLLRHLDLMRSQSPEESCHVMRPEHLFEADALLLGAWDDAHLLGVGALVQIAPGEGELKSMHTAEQARGRGVGGALLSALIDKARGLGLVRLSLETGSAASFKPARSLYAAHGFHLCPPFGEYVEDPLSAFMTREV